MSEYLSADDLQCPESKVVLIATGACLLAYLDAYQLPECRLGGQLVVGATPEMFKSIAQYLMCFVESAEKVYAPPIKQGRTTFQRSAGDVVGVQSRQGVVQKSLLRSWKGCFSPMYKVMARISGNERSTPLPERVPEGQLRWLSRKGPWVDCRETERRRHAGYSTAEQ